MTEPFIDNAALANDDPESRARHLAIKLGWVTQERDEYQAGLDLLRWLHAEACWQRDAERASRQAWAAEAMHLDHRVTGTVGAEEIVGRELDDFAAFIDRGPDFPLHPGIFSAMARERAEEVRAGVRPLDVDVMRGPAEASAEPRVLDDLLAAEAAKLAGEQR